MSLNVPVVTGYSPFWSNVMSPTQPQGGMYTSSIEKSRAKGAYAIARLMNKGGMRDARAALAVLIGAVAGTTANSTFTQRIAQTTPTSWNAFGGNIPMQTYATINRATTAADITELKKWFAQGLLESGITYPTVVGNSLSNGRMQAGGTGRF